MNEPAAAGGFLRFDEVVKRFDGVTAVDRVSLDIAQGEIVALLGPSGCGKSTLLRMVAGFETPSTGRIELDGQDLAPLPPHRRPLNLMFQSYALFPHMTVAQNVGFGLKYQRLDAAAAEARVASMLRLVQMQDLAGRKPHQLSGGQQQRVALARSLARQPRLLLLDEPLGALDRKLREQTQLELVHIVQQVGVTCLIVTHDQDEAMTMASRIAVMHEGRLRQVGTPQQIYEAPADRFVADFIGNVNLMDGQVESVAADQSVVACADVRQCVSHRVEQPPGARVTVALRPEKIHLTRHAPAQPQLNAVQGTVREMAYFGSFTVFHLALASGAMLKVSHANLQRHREDLPQPGEAAWAHWSREAQIVLVG